MQTQYLLRGFGVDVPQFLHGIPDIILQADGIGIVEFPLQLVDAALQVLDFFLLGIVIVEEVGDGRSDLQSRRNNGEDNRCFRWLI